MNCPPVLYLAGAYIRRHIWKSILVISSLIVLIAFPAGVHLMVRTFELQLVERSQQTPFILGARGSQLDLVLHGLYFKGKPPTAIQYGELENLKSIGLAQSYPVHARHTARGLPVVGVTLEYFTYRNLICEQGRKFSILAEAVLGSRAADALGLDIGDTLVTDSDNVFNIAGSYPLELNITGILQFSDSPDDEVIFVDIKSAWLMDGIGHGHQAVDESLSQSLILSKEGKNIQTNAALLPYTRITSENIRSIHFHGNEAEFPLTQVLVVPENEKSASILAGRYISDTSMVQLVRPDLVVHELLGVVFRVKSFFNAQIWVVGITTLLLVGLVISLSLRLRQKEMKTFFVLGCSPSRQFQLLAAEILLYVISASLVSACLLIFLNHHSTFWLRLLTMH